jgi:fatty acid desaturase
MLVKYLGRMTRVRAAIGLAVGLVVAGLVLGGRASAVLLLAALAPLAYAVFAEVRRLREQDDAGTAGGSDTLPGAGLPPF